MSIVACAILYSNWFCCESARHAPNNSHNDITMEKMELERRLESMSGVLNSSAQPKSTPGYKAKATGMFILKALFSRL
jgi:hypothetical protein